MYFSFYSINAPKIRKLSRKYKCILGSPLFGVDITPKWALIAAQMAAILLGELKEGLRFESVFGFDAEFLPTIDKEVALGRKLFEQFDITVGIP